MRAGLYPLSVIAEFLGCRPEAMARMVKDDELPVIPVPTERKNVNKVSLLGFHRWLTRRSVNKSLTMDELEQELDRAAKALTERHQEQYQRRKLREGLAV